TTRSVLEYACQVFHSSLPYYLSEELERIQKRALRIIFPYASYNSALKEAGIPSLYDRRASLSSDLFNDIVLDINHKLAGLLPPKAEHHRQLRSNRKFYVPVCKTDRLKKSLIVSHSLSINLICIRSSSRYSLRNNDTIFLERPKGVMRTTLGARLFHASAPALWNSLPAHIRTIDSLVLLKKSLKSYLFKQAF
ncbi:hypothetical protein pdam_00007045, partial [Pocillopora damicornis]